MSVDITGYNCPNCGGILNFDISTQKSKCGSCGAVFERAAADGALWEDLDVGGLTSGGCPSCGAEFYGGENTVAMVCPCCGGAQVVAKRVSNLLKPDFVIPFKRDKHAAAEALAEFCADRRLLPSAFSAENHVESIHGIYVPFWLFDAKVSGRAEYEAIRGETNGDDTEIVFYSVEREGSLTFENIPVDGSEKMDDEFMDAIEPFDYKEMQVFHPSYLAGYTAEKYDVDAEKCKPRAAARIQTGLADKFKHSFKDYDEIETVSSSIKIHEAAVGYALFPVWVLNTKRGGDKYVFMMNGQTGKLAGTLPVDKGKARMYKAAFTGAIGVVVTALLYLVLMFVDSIDLINGAAASPIAISIAALLSFAGAAAVGSYYVSEWARKMNTVALRDSAAGYVVPGSVKYSVKKDTVIDTLGDCWKEGHREDILKAAGDPWAAPLRKKSSDVGPWTEFAGGKRSFHEIDKLTESPEEGGSDDW